MLFDPRSLSQSTPDRHSEFPKPNAYIKVTNSFVMPVYAVT